MTWFTWTQVQQVTQCRGRQDMEVQELELYLAAPHLQKRGQPGGALVPLPQPDERGCVLAPERSSLESRLRLSGLIRPRHRAPR